MKVGKSPILMLADVWGKMGRAPHRLPQCLPILCRHPSNQTLTAECGIFKVIAGKLLALTGLCVLAHMFTAAVEISPVFAEVPLPYSSQNVNVQLLAQQTTVRIQT